MLNTEPGIVKLTITAIITITRLSNGNSKQADGRTMPIS